ncbi:MAG: hypothetical protein RLZZ111_900 [Planctomycetota bacterium]|jgi:hypothetical protein
MTAQKGLDMHRENAVKARWNGARAGTARSTRPNGPRVPAFTAVIVCSCVLTSVGCKTGTSFAKPSWWTLGGGKADAGTLAAAPPYEGDIKKPSETAKPYPTTSTPNGYVITGSAGATGLAAQGQSPQPTAPVVYGSTPPAPALPSASTAALPAAPTGVGGPATGGSSLGPQVGPYATLAGDTIPPPGQPLPPIGPSSMPAAPTAVPTEAPLPGLAGSAFPAAVPPSQASSFDPAAARMADSRFAPAAAPAAPPAAPPAAAPVSPAAISPPAAAALAAEPAVAGGSRYGSSSGSRFAGTAEAGFPSSAAGSSAFPASYGRPDEPPAAPSAAPFSAPPAPAASPAAPSAAPGLLQPSGQPVRRPDSGYRPGGTSSYRPSRSLLADDTPSTADAVRTAAFEEPAATRQ